MGGKSNESIRKGIRSVKNLVMGCWHGCLSEARCRFAYGPADATATHYLLFQEIQIALPSWFTFPYWLIRVVLDKVQGAVKRL